MRAAQEGVTISSSLQQGESFASEQGSADIKGKDHAALPNVTGQPPKEYVRGKKKTRKHQAEFILVSEYNGPGER